MGRKRLNDRPTGLGSSHSLLTARWHLVTARWLPGRSFIFGQPVCDGRLHLIDDAVVEAATHGRDWIVKAHLHDPGMDRPIAFAHDLAASRDRDRDNRCSGLQGHDESALLEGLEASI